MKKKLTIMLLSIMMIMILTACGKKNEDEVSNVKEVAIDGDVLRCMQGDWYYWDDNGNVSSFSIVDHEFKDISKMSITGSETSGELILYQNLTNIKTGHKWKEAEGNLYYKYDSASDTVELTYNGNTYKKENDYEKINSLISGDWYLYDNGFYKLAVSFEDDKARLGTVSYDYKIKPNGEIIIFGNDRNDNTDYTVKYVYNKSTKNVNLTAETGMLYPFESIPEDSYDKIIR